MTRDGQDILDVARPEHLWRRPARPPDLELHDARLQRLLAHPQPRRVHPLCRLVRQQRLRARRSHRPEAVVVQHERPRLQLARHHRRPRTARPRRSTSRPPTARSMRSARPAGCCGATTRATRFAPRPVLGRAPKGSGHILYVGASDGSLYAIDAESGRRRWSFDSTPSDRALRDRNDLNGSPALGRRGIYVGGEHGRLVYVPYDYCLHRADRRCNTRPGEAFSGDLTQRLLRHPRRQHQARARARGATHGDDRERAPGGTPRREDGRCVDHGWRRPSRRSCGRSPRFDFAAALSGDGHFLHVVPRGFLAPNTRYRVRIAGDYAAGGRPVANTVVDQKRAGRFGTTIRFRTARAGKRLPLAVSAQPRRRLQPPPPGRPAAADAPEPQSDRV